jgi:glucose-6-phosphate 1-dehydrogenase
MEPATIVLFGATGDLAKRKIYPALYRLFVSGNLSHPFSLVGLGRRAWTDESFQQNVEKSLRTYAAGDLADEASIRRFVSAFRFCVLDVGCKDDYLKLKALVESRENELGMPGNRLFYLSVGPEHFESIALNIQRSGLGEGSGWKRLVIEKPFGQDLKSAQALNHTLSQAFAEEEIFRIDHYLGKSIVQRLESLRQIHPVLASIQMKGNVANVQITADESIGVEERAGYYDQAGAIRDMFQNHLLQLMMMAAIHLPDVKSTSSTHAAKKAVMDALRPLDKATVGSYVVRGQYAQGTVQGVPVAGYLQEPGIAPGSSTDTFFAARLQIDSDDWRGVPFYIRTGKRLKEKTTKIVVEFKKPLGPVTLADGTAMEPNLLVLEIGPKERISLQRQSKPSSAVRVDAPQRLDLFEQPSGSPEAYENLIRDALRGDATYFAHWDEVEASWRWVEPILQAFADGSVPLFAYPAGTFGPRESERLLAEDGFHWWFDDHPNENIKKETNIDIKEGERYVYHANC